VYWRFSNTRFLLPIGQTRTLPTGVLLYQPYVTSFPRVRELSRVVYAVAGNGSERAGSRRSAARACRSTSR